MTKSFLHFSDENGEGCINLRKVVAIRYGDQPGSFGSYYIISFHFTGSVIKVSFNEKDTVDEFYNKAVKQWKAIFL